MIIRMKDVGLGVALTWWTGYISLKFAKQVLTAETHLDFSLQNHKLLSPQPVYHCSSLIFFSWPPEKFNSCCLLVGVLPSLGSEGNCFSHYV